MARSEHTAEIARIVTTVAVGVIAVGVFSLCQPWSMTLYRNGFQILLVGTLTYIVTSHLE